LIQSVVDELRDSLTGRFFGKLYQLGPVSFAIDFGLRGEFLFISVDPANLRFYLIRRRTKDLERQSTALSTFGQAMRSKLSSAHVLSITKDPLDRIVHLTFRLDLDSQSVFRRLVIQLTGRTADLFLLDELNRIDAILREPSQTRIHQFYQPPPRPLKEPPEVLKLEAGPPSAQLDKHFSALDAAKAFDSKAKAIRSRVTKSIRQQRTLEDNLRNDLVRHGDPEEHKRTGDLLLANIATAAREGNKVRLTDYYADGAPLIEIEVEENRSLQDEAAARFRQYTKAKRAADEIAERLKQIDRETAKVERRLQQLDTIIQSRV
jgi:predicted ribosome quality control (RQC) complex YloA/Tae2 family protein